MSGQCVFKMSEQEPDQHSLEENVDSKNEPNEKKVVEDKTMTEVNGEIGYYLKKGTQFIPMTNFSVTCTGYVTENSKSDCPEGFLFNVVPKTTILQGEDEEDSLHKRQVKTTLFNKHFYLHVQTEAVCVRFMIISCEMQ